MAARPRTSSTSTSATCAASSATSPTYGLALRTLRGRGFVLDRETPNERACSLPPAPAVAGGRRGPLRPADGAGRRSRTRRGRAAWLRIRGGAAGARDAGCGPDGAVRLAVVEVRARATRARARPARRTAASGRSRDFPAGGANPVLLYFLETTVRDLRRATGGSPYYIRNRMREALVAADLGAGRRSAGGHDRALRQATRTGSGWARSPT